jgi:hypothetical protein
LADNLNPPPLEMGDFVEAGALERVVICGKYATFWYNTPERARGVEGGSSMDDHRRRCVRFGFYLAWLLVLLVTVALSGCKQVRGVLRSGHPVSALRGERLIAYEQGGNIWTISAAGDGARQISETGNLMLESWAPDSARLAVLSAISPNGEGVTGNAGVLDLSGNLKPVTGPEGAITVEPGEISWLDGNSLVLGDGNTIWVARFDGSQYRATPLYAAKDDNNERVWRPRAVPGGAYVSFWITSTGDTDGNVAARLVILPVAGGEPDTIFSQAILASGQAPVDVVWAPDAHYVLVYVEPASGDNRWWLLDRSRGANQAVLSADAGDVQWMAGDQLLYAPHAQAQVPRYAELDAATGKSTPFVVIPSWTNWLQVAPDSRLLLAKATGDSNISWDYYVAAADGSNIKKIITNAGDADWQP